MKKLTTLSRLLWCAVPVFLVTNPVLSAQATPTDAGHVRFFNNADTDWEAFLNNADNSARLWLNDHFYKMLVHEPYFDDKNGWYGGGLAYINSYALYVDDPVVYAHPEWILHDAQGHKLYIPWACNNGACTQFAGDIGNTEFRQFIIEKIKGIIAKGYRGIWLDDVNLTWRISDGYGTIIPPIDARTGNTMTLEGWQSYFADYLEQIRAAIPTAQIAHNVIWYSDSFDAPSAYVNRQIEAANYLNIERGGNDDGLVGGGGTWGFETFLKYIDRVHAHGASVIMMDNSLGAPTNRAKVEYGLATWLLISQGNDLLSNIATNKMSWAGPENWWPGYSVNLGSAVNNRYRWNNLLRRDFNCGMVLLNQPDMPTVTATIGSDYQTIDGQAVSSVSLAANQAAVLTHDCSTATVQAISAGADAAITHTFQQGVAGYNGARDTTLISSLADTNRGSYASLSLQGNPDSNGVLLSWDISEIPQNAIVQSVSLGFTVTSTSTATYELYEMKTPWLENEATWTQASLAQSWVSPGVFNRQDRSPTILGALAGTALGRLSVNLNSDGIALVQSWIAHPEKNYGFYIMDFMASDNLTVSSNEAATLSNRPQLSITYKLP